MESYRWETEQPHTDNSETMCDWIDNHCPYRVELVDGTYAEIVCEEGDVYACHASGDGDSYHHKITFELI